MRIKRTAPGLVWVEGEGSAVVPRTVAELAELLGVTVQTVNRWARGAPIPRTAELALEAAVLGHLPHPRWAGWRLDAEGRLWAPNGPGSRRGFVPAELEWWAHVFQENRLLHAKLVRLARTELKRRGPARAERHQADGEHQVAV